MRKEHSERNREENRRAIKASPPHSGRNRALSYLKRNLLIMHPL